jgi:hypothetical protein
MSGTVYCASRRTRGARKKITAIPNHAPADCHNAGSPTRYPSPAPANRLPDPIQVESSVKTRTEAGSDRPATMKSSLLGEAAPRVRQIPIAASATR